jgi:hypothetical protein
VSERKYTPMDYDFDRVPYSHSIGADVTVAVEGLKPDHYAKRISINGRELCWVDAEQTDDFIAALNIVIDAFKVKQ